MKTKRVYIVAAIDIYNEHEDLTNEEIDNILNEMEYSFEHPSIIYTEIIENQFPYHDQN